MQQEFPLTYQQLAVSSQLLQVATGVPALPNPLVEQCRAQIADYLGIPH